MLSLLSLFLFLASLGLFLAWKRYLRSCWWAGRRPVLWPMRLLSALLVLSMILLLAALLTGCASPCRPSIQPNMTSAATGRAGMVESIGILCQWAY